MRNRPGITANAIDQGYAGFPGRIRHAANRVRAVSAAFAR